MNSNSKASAGSSHPNAKMAKIIEVGDDEEDPEVLEAMARFYAARANSKRKGKSVAMIKPANEEAAGLQTRKALIEVAEDHISRFVLTNINSDANISHKIYAVTEPHTNETHSTQFHRNLCEELEAVALERFWEGEDFKKYVYALKGVRFADTTNKADIMLDSGASKIMVPSEHWFKEGTYRPRTNTFVYLADDSPLRVEGTGTIDLELGGKTRSIRNVLHVPGLTEALLSITHLLSQTKDAIILQYDRAYYFNALTRQFIEFGKRRGDLYYMTLYKPKDVPDSAARVRVRPPPNRLKPYLLWHAILNHASREYVMRTLDKYKVPYDFQGDVPICPACLFGQAKRRSIPPSDSPLPKRFLYRLYGDMIYLPVQGYYNEHFGELLMDAYSGYVWTVWFHAIGDAGPKCVEFLKTLKRQYPDSPLHELHSDRGELKDGDVGAWCQGQDPPVIQRFSPAETKEFNGRIERQMGIMSARANTLLITARLPAKYKRFAFDYAVFVHNNVIPRKSDSKTPSELLGNPQFDVFELQPFGCLVAVYLTKEQRPKHGAVIERAISGCFLGFKGSTILLVYVHRLQRVVEAFHVRFHPYLFPGLNPSAAMLHPFATLNFKSFTEITGGQELEQHASDLSANSKEFGPNAVPSQENSNSTEAATSTPRDRYSGELVVGQNAGI